MSPCPTCGRTHASAGKIVLWCVGLLSAGMVGLVMLIIVCLTAVAVIGEQADAEFQEISQRIDRHQAQPITDKEWQLR